MIYITFLLVFIISKGVDEFNESTNFKYNELHYKDLTDNYVDVEGFCDNLTCVLKCCNHDGEVLNSAGICNKASDDDIRNYSFSLVLWETVADALRRVEKDIAFIKNDDFVGGSPGQFITTKFYLQKNGTLIVRNQEKFVLVPSLQFCVDYLRDSSSEKTLEVAAVYTLDGILNRDAAYDNLFGYGLGMLSSVIAVTYLVYRIPKKMRQPLSSILIMFSLAIFSAYVLKIAQLSAVITHFESFSDCRVISPVLYCFVFTALCWTNVMLCDLTYRVSYFREKCDKKRRIFDKSSSLRTLCYHIYGSGVPLLMTAAAIAVDKFDLFSTFAIEKTPFESCFVNEWSTMLYLHIPFAIFLLLDCILFLRFIVLILEHRDYVFELVEKMPQLKNSPSIKTLTINHRNLIVKKIVVAIFISCMLEILNIQTIPVVLYLALHAYNICIIVSLVIIMISKRSIFTSQISDSLEKQSSEVRNKETDHLEATQYLKDVKANMACIKLFGWDTSKTSEDKKKLIVWTTEVV